MECYKVTRWPHFCLSSFWSMFCACRWTQSMTKVCNSEKVMNFEKDMKSRKALAWVACNKLNKIWHSTLANETKVYIFKTLIEPILLYGAETWTLTTRQQKRLTEHTQTCLDASKTSIGRSMPPSSTYMEISRFCHKRSSSGGYHSPDTATEPQRK